MTHLSHQHKITALLAAGAVVVLTLGGLTWLLLSPGDDEPITDVPAVSSTSVLPAPTTTVPSLAEGDRTEDNTGTGVDGGEYRPREEGLPLPPMGIASASLQWEQIELPRPETGEFWVNELFEIDGRLIATGGWWNERDEQVSTLIFESPDGLVWSEIAVPEELRAAGVHNIVPAGNRVVAFGEQWPGDGRFQELSVFISPDAHTWARVDVAAFAGEDERLWLWEAAGNDDTILLTGNLERIFDEPAWEAQPIVIHKNGLTLELDNLTNSFLITDDATGTVLLYGSQEIMWDYEREEGGAVLYDPETGERVFSVTWEELNRRAEEAYRSTPFGGDLVVDIRVGGLELAVDQYTRQIAVTDLASQTVLFTGSEDMLWQGQPPTFIDPRTDTVVLRLSWDDWNAAHDAVYAVEEAPEFWSRSIVLVSQDGGATFTEVDLTAVAGEGFYVSTVAGGPAGFLASGGTEGPGTWEGEGGWEQTPAMLESADGLEWTELTTNLATDSWIEEITAGAGGYLATVHSETGPVVLQSGDGATWTPMLEVDDLELPLGSAWFNRAAAGDFGTFVVGSRDGWEAFSDPEPMVTSKQGRTLTIAGPLYTLIDDATGATLFTFDEQAFWMEPPEDSEVQSPVRWGEGGFAIFDEDGSLLYALSHQEQDIEEDWEDPEEWYEPEQLLLRHDGTAWASVQLPGNVGTINWFSNLVVGEDRVVLAATLEGYNDPAGIQRLFVFVGTDER